MTNLGKLGFTAIAIGIAAMGAVPSASERGAFQEYAVAADHPLASQAGSEVLAAGGNAADAAAATMLVLGVVNPQSSGLGGGGFALYYDAKTKKTSFLDFRERAPEAATADMFERNEPKKGARLSTPSQFGGLASGVPGEPAGIERLVRGFGRKSLREVAEPALRLAGEGFPVHTALAKLSAPFARQLRDDPVMRQWFPRGREPEEGLREGDTLQRPALLKTLRTFSARGSSGIYRGPVAAQIVRANQAAGGSLTLSDLRSYAVVERDPLEAEALGFRWSTAPPPSAGGYTMVASLQLLDAWSARSLDGDQLLHAFAESWKGPFFDRMLYFGDPDHIDVPVARLLDPTRIARRAAIYRPSLSMPAQDYALPLARETEAPITVPDGHGTSHLCAVDAEGNVAAVTTTVNLPFGARYTAAGLVMNDEMDDFASREGEQNAFGLAGGAPNLPGPGKRPVSSMTPTIVFDQSGPVLCVGGSGGSRIVTAAQQVAWHVLVRRLSPADAIDEPRVHHQGVPDALRTEEPRPVLPELAARLETRGHHLQSIGHVAVVQAIQIRAGQEPRLLAASDARKGGSPHGR